MKIISLNTSKPQKITVNGKDEYTGYFKKAVSHPLFLGKEGVKDDTVVDTIHHGGVDKACYLYSYDHYNYWKNIYNELEWDYGMFGENITVAGLNESEIRIGDVFSIGSAIVQVSQPRQPCHKLCLKFNSDKIMRDFINSPYPGVYVRILKEGLVEKSNEFILVETNEESETVSEIFSMLYKIDVEKEGFEKALKNPFLSEAIKKHFREKTGLRQA